ncbi:UNVERIFIED_CONTAM: hypothetical protein FKN15_072476 [Acipenser sinensis]
MFPSRIQSPAQTEQVLVEVRKMIGSYPFKIQGARILSGVDEGAYGWIAINYLLSSFIKHAGRDLSFPCPTKPEPYLPDSRVMFTGSGSPAQCASLIKTIFSSSACAGKPECSFDGVYQPSAFSAFFYTFDFLKLAPQSSLDVKKKTTEEFCKRDWSSVRIGEKENNLREYCATSYYITTILADAYKFDNQSWNKIVFEKRVRERDSDDGRSDVRQKQEGKKLTPDKVMQFKGFRRFNSKIKINKIF